MNKQKFIEFYKKVWMGRLHHITPDLVNIAGELLEEKFKVDDRWYFEQAVQKINNLGIKYYNEMEEDKKRTEELKKVFKEINKITIPDEIDISDKTEITVPTEVFEELKEVKSIDFIPSEEKEIKIKINNKKTKKRK